ncbi:MAG: type II toxin-antitoxin system PemK/MazF family toxin, partial [Peptostreptococcaceae bacterium]
HKIKLPTHVRVNAGENGLKQESFIMAEQVTTANKTSLCGKIGRLSDQDIIKLNRALEVQINLVHTKEEEIAKDKLSYIEQLETFVIKWVNKGMALNDIADDIRELNMCVKEYSRYCESYGINNRYKNRLQGINFGYSRQIAI